MAIPNQLLRQLPNTISSVRVLLVPLWVVLAELANRNAEAGGDAATPRWWATTALLTIGLSDVLDGWLARRLRLQSRLGATLDAIADKLAQVVLFTYLALREGPAFAAVPLWFLVLLVARDAILIAGCLTIRRRHGTVDIEHETHGKAASLVLFALLVAVSAGAPGVIREPLLVAAAAIVAASTLRYVWRGVRQYRYGVAVAASGIAEKPDSAPAAKSG